jgi:feruloyl esterase
MFRILMLAVAAACAGAQSASVAQTRCDISGLAPLNTDAVSIRAAAIVESGRCRIQASVSAARGSSIEFEVWIPVGWNGKLVVTGNGGYGNTLSVRDMTDAVARGYAVAGGDTGHQGAPSDDLLWGAGHPERITDWGSRSIHAITAPTRRIVEMATGRRIQRAYFNGCSTGGHQAYAEIQRYPQDFDGVVAGAPGNNRVRLNAGFLWQFLANRRHGDNSALIIPAAKLPLITNAVVASCDANDGVTDGVVDDPRTCRFDPGSLQCSGSEGPGCLTAEQVSALNRMYDGARNPRTGEQIYPGWPRSSEALTTTASGAPGSGWQQYWGGSEPTRVNFWRHWVFANPAWDWWSFDFDRDLRRADEKIGRLVDQRKSDLGDFKRRGGKAIVYQGWQDPVVNAIDTIAYYEQVRSKQGSQQETDRFFRLFLVPGMGHCFGGTGTTAFDPLAALDAWVDRGIAPDRITASRVVDGATIRTRPLCPYPMKAVYLGSGSSDEAANFVCR